MRVLGKHALVIGSSILVGVGIFYATYFVIDFLWMHLVVKNPEDVGLSDGVVVISGWYIFGTIFGSVGLFLMLTKFWPRRTSK